MNKELNKYELIEEGYLINYANNNYGEMICVICKHDGEISSIRASEIYTIDNIDNFDISEVQSDEMKYLFDCNTELYYSVNHKK